MTGVSRRDTTPERQALMVQPHGSEPVRRGPGYKESLQRRRQSRKHFGTRSAVAQPRHDWSGVAAQATFIFAPCTTGG